MKAKAFALNAEFQFVSFRIAKDPMFLCAFDCTTYTGKVSFGWGGGESVRPPIV